MTMTVLGLLALALMAAHLLAVGLFLIRLGRARVAPCGVIGQPFVTLLRPVCGLDPLEEETLRSSFLQDYPDYEIIFCAPLPDDPVIPLLPLGGRDAALVLFAGLPGLRDHLLRPVA